MDLSHLNEAQRAAVTAADGTQLVVAGAGTGKTRTLVHRVAWLIEQGVEPANIVLLTFTRRAANEMLQRAAKLVGPTARRVRGGTFHAFAVTALRRHAPTLGWGRDFTILDRADAEALVGLVRSAVNTSEDGRLFPKRNQLLKIISRAINTQRELSDILEHEYPHLAEYTADIERIAKGYQQRKRSQNVFDFDDLLVQLEVLLSQHPTARERIGAAARYVLVDEYQDTNALQARIAGWLSMVHGNLMVVGDEAQSIYGFRGADVRNILHFTEMFPDVELLRLEQNYRSSMPVLELANGVLRSATEGFDKKLFSDRTEGPMPELVEVFDEHEQAEHVVSRILERVEQGVPLHEQAVLFRAGFHSSELELQLGAADIPFKKYGGLQFTEAAHIKDSVALMRLVANPVDGLALFRVVQWFDGLGAKTATKIVTEVEETGRFDPSSRRGRRYGGALAYLAGVLEDAAPLREDLPALLEHLLEYYTPLLHHLHDNPELRERDFDTLRSLAQRATSLEELLADLSLDPPGSAEAAATDEIDDWLTLSTIHSAKGLEWDAVSVLSLLDGYFPGGRAVDDAEALEEERRLLYVAVTRARTWLDLMRPRVMRGRGQVFGLGCRLLEDIEGLTDLVSNEKPEAPAPKPPPPQSPALDAGKDRMAAFLAFHAKKKR